jgi:hypothetical protein
MATNEEQTVYKEEDRIESLQETTDAAPATGDEILMIDNGEYNDEKRREDDQAAASTIIEATVDDHVAKLDFLGPIIINTDGTLARIPNWNSLTTSEQTNTLRLIAKRNKARIEILKQEQPDLVFSHTQTLDTR